MSSRSISETLETRVENMLPAVTVDVQDIAFAEEQA